MRVRITEMRKKLQDGTLGDWIPLGAKASDIEVEVDTSIDENGYTDLQTLIESGEIGGKVEWTYI